MIDGKVSWVRCLHLVRTLMRAIGFLALCSYLTACTTGHSDLARGEAPGGGTYAHASAYRTSIITLLAGRGELEGKIVQVEGYLAADWEGPIVFFSHEHCQTYSSYDGVGLILGAELSVDWSQYRDPDCRRVIVEGTYKFFSIAEYDSSAISFRIVQAVMQDVRLLADIAGD